MKIVPYLNRILFIMVIFAAISCSKNDDDNSPQLETWEMEVEKVKSATSQYLNFEETTNNGLIDVSGYVPNMGHHYLNPTLADGTFELEKPEIILYAPDENNVMQMVGVEYSIVPIDPNNPGTPPEGFTGDQDEWHFNEMVGQWQLHVWTILENPDGIFAPFNPEVVDNSPPLEDWEIEVEQVKSATSQYLNFGEATNNGLTDVSGYVPNMGHHYLNSGLLDDTFELEKPEIILYVPDENNVMQMVAVEYSIVPSDPNNPGSPPEGFTGDQDHWHFNTMLGQWQLHVWTILENPDGVFASFNPEIGD